MKPGLSMLEQIPLLLATPIAKIVLEKFYEGFGSKLGEKAIELATMPIQEVGKLAWAKCFADKTQDDLLVPGTGELKEEEKATLVTALDDADFVAAVKPIAQQIHQAIVQVDASNAKNVQIISGGQGLQVNEKQDQPIIQIQGNPTLNFGKSGG